MGTESRHDGTTPPARLTVAREPDWLRMTNELTFRISTTPFDEHYSPSAESRATTNFANLARGEDRRQNLRNVLTMIDRRCNDLARWDNPDGDRYAVELEIVSVDAALTVDGDERHFPLLEVLDVHIRDLHTGARHHGIVGNNFSSYVRDYDFSVRLPAVTADAGAFTVPDDFGALHGALFQAFLDSDAYRARFEAPPVICISVSTSKTYRRTDNTHPVLGVEYLQSEYSLTDEYFSRMGLRVRYFMPAGAAAPLAFYFRGDLANDYTNLQLVGTISTMESFQKIYRPEIYNANAAAGSVYRPSLEHGDFSRTQIDYDRVERAQLAITQGTYAAEHFLAPYGDVLARWVGLEPALAR